MFKRLTTHIRPRENDRMIRWAKLVVLSALLGFMAYLAASRDGMGGLEPIICALVGAIVKL